MSPAAHKELLNRSWVKKKKLFAEFTIGLNPQVDTNDRFETDNHHETELEANEQPETKDHHKTDDQPKMDDKIDEGNKGYHNKILTYVLV